MSNHLKSINNNNATTMSTTKVVEIVRSKYGYGFTLSGEMPCHLTEVKGHANVAGLNSGDRLNTVNGECVDRLTHAQVVSLITKVADGRLSLGITPFDIMDECSLPSTDDDDDEDEEEGVPGARSISSCSMMTTTSTSSSTSSICDVTTAASTTTTSKKAVGDVSRLIPIRSDLANLTSNNGRDKSPSSLPLPMQSHHSRTKRSTERTNVNHKVRNILRPSQTYETNFNNCNNNINKLSRIRRHRSNIGLLHLSDSDLPNGEQESTQTQRMNNNNENRRHLRSYSRPIRPRSILIKGSSFGTDHHHHHHHHQQRRRQFQSFDNLKLIDHDDDDDDDDDEPLLLHQHYRINRTKSNGKKQQQQTIISSEALKSCRSQELRDAIQKTNNLVRRSIDFGPQTNKTIVSHRLEQYAPPPPPPPLKPPPPSLPPSSSASLNTSTSTNNTVNTNRVKCKNGKIPKNSRKTNSTTSGISSTSPSSLSSSESSPSSTSERDPNRTIIPSSSLSSLEPNQVPIPTPAKRFSRLKKPQPQSSSQQAQQQQQQQQSTLSSCTDRQSIIDENNLQHKASKGDDVVDHEHDAQSMMLMMMASKKRMNNNNNTNNQGYNERVGVVLSDDCHSHAIIRSIVRCLGVSTHQYQHEHVQHQHQQQQHRSSSNDHRSSSYLSDIVRTQMCTYQINSCTKSRDNQYRSMALMAAYTDELYLVSNRNTKSENCSSTIIKADQILYCSLTNVDDSNYFALITNEANTGHYQTKTNDNINCYLFQTDPTVASSHQSHCDLGRMFGINCTTDPISGNCLEFPENAEQILRVMFSLYRKQLAHQQYQQHTTTTTTTTEPIKSSHHTKRVRSHRSNVLLHTQFNGEIGVNHQHHEIGLSNSKSMTLESNHRTIDQKDDSIPIGCTVDGNRRPRRQPPPPPPPLFHSVPIGSLPNVTVEEDNSSTLSCCATTSCESFSFHHHQQHQQQQQQQQIQRLPTEENGNWCTTTTKRRSEHVDAHCTGSSMSATTFELVRMRPIESKLLPPSSSSLHLTKPTDDDDDDGGKNGETSAHRKESTTATTITEQDESNCTSVSYQQSNGTYGTKQPIVDHSILLKQFCDHPPSPPPPPPPTSSTTTSQIANIFDNQPNSGHYNNNHNNSHPYRSHQRSASVRPKSFLDIGNNGGINNRSDIVGTIRRPMHFMLDSYASCNDLTTNRIVSDTINRSAYRTQYFNPINSSLSPFGVVHSQKQFPQPLNNNQELNNPMSRCGKMMPTNSRDITKQLNQIAIDDQKMADQMQMQKNFQIKSETIDSFGDNNEMMIANPPTTIDIESGASLSQNLDKIPSNDDGQRKPTVKIGVVGKQDGIEIETNQILQKQDSSTVNRFDGSVPSNVILFDGVYCGSSTSNVNPDGNNVGKLQHSTSNAIRDEYCWMDSPPDLISERPIDVGWVGGWATEFDILLADPIGIKVFSEFLNKEYSYENLKFFLEVQEFKKLTNQEELQTHAETLFKRFFEEDPINVDWKVRKPIQACFQTPEQITNRMFAVAEKQIYNLMKFDSYQRFLKSEIYKECVLLELQGKPLPYQNDSGCDDVTSSSAHTSVSSFGKQASVDQILSGNGTGTKADKTKSKRRSLIPWHRIKNSIISHKAASLSSMPSQSSKDGQYTGANSGPSSTSNPSNQSSTKRQPMMMRKITNSITKIRSKSLDDHLTNHIKPIGSNGDAAIAAANAATNVNVKNKSGKESSNSSSSTRTNTPSSTITGKSSSMDKSTMDHKSSMNHGDSRNSLMNSQTCGSDSIDLSEHNNVFSPSPDNIGSIEIDERPCTMSNESGNSGTSSTEQSPINSNRTNTVATAFNHNCNRDNCHFLRVVFPDRSQTVVPSTPNETVETLIQRLLIKRSLQYYAYEVYVTGDNNKPLDPNTNINTLGCTEIRVEQRVLFQMDFPNGDSIGIKTRPNKLCTDVFIPLLIKFKYKPEHIVLTINGGNGEELQLSQPVSSIDGQRIIASLRDDVEEWGLDQSGRSNIPVALCSSKHNDTTIGPGDDTQSDAFYKEINDQQHNLMPCTVKPSPTTSPYKIVNSEILQVANQAQQSQSSLLISTSSVAYGITGSTTLNQPSSINRNHHHHSLEESSKMDNLPNTVRRFNSIGGQQQILSSEKKPDQTMATTTTQPLPSLESVERNSYKANPLRELANHHHFISAYHETIPVSDQYILHSNNGIYDLKSSSKHGALQSGHQRYHSEMEPGSSSSPPPLPPKSTLNLASQQQTVATIPPPPPRPVLSSKANVQVQQQQQITGQSIAFPVHQHQHHHHHPHHPLLYHNHNTNAHHHHLQQQHHHHHHYHQHQLQHQQANVVSNKGGGTNVSGGSTTTTTVIAGDASYV